MNQFPHGAATRRMAAGRDVFALSVLAAMISNAYAQTNPAPAQQPAAQPATTAQAPASDTPLTTVTVSGYRSSLSMSAMEKRDNIGLSDSVFAEDMGKFPDPNIADALARVPGVTISRSELDGEGTSISIRGMGAAFTRVTLNGAPMSSASGGGYGSTPSANREVDLDFLPSELFRRATVYKSAVASMLEGGIAGNVDMRSVRPFDKSGFRSAFTVSGNYRDLDGKFGNTGSGLVSNTWNTGIGKIGVLGGFAFGNTKFFTEKFEAVDMRNFQLLSNQSSAADNPNSTAGGSMSTPTVVPAGLPLDQLPDYARAVLVPGATIDKAMLLALNPGATIQQIDNGLMGRLGRHMLLYGDRQRKGEVLSLQWQPNQDWNVYLDSIFAQKGSTFVQESMNAGTRPATPIPIGLTFDRSDCSAGCTITSGIFANTFWGMEFRPQKENTHFRSFNPGFEFRPSDKLTIDGNLNYTSSSFYRLAPSILLATQSAPSVIKYDNTTAGETPLYTSNTNLNDPNAGWGWYQSSNGGASALRTNLYERTNTTKGARLNLTWGDEDFTVKGGAVRDDISRRYFNWDQQPNNAWQNIACGNNMNDSFFAPNTTIQGSCDGRVAPGPVSATAYPGYGTGVTAGASTPLAYLGSVVPNSKVASYLSPGSHGFVVLNWPQFAQDTNYQTILDNLRNNITSSNASSIGGYLREVVDSAYAEVTGRTQFFGRTLRYDGGLRYARTVQTIGTSVYQEDPRNATLSQGGLYPGTLGWVYETKKYSNVLPSGALAYNLRKDVILRVAASKSMTRANPNDLKQTRLYLGDQALATASVTNPNLKPFRANNLDLGLEWYYAKEAYFAAGVFAKDLLDRPLTKTNIYTLTQLQQKYSDLPFTLSQQQQLVVDNDGGPDKHLIAVSEPVNITSKLKVRGIELSWQQPLDMLPVKGFGFAANFTYTRQKDETPGGPPVANVPPRTNNLSVYYERNGVNVRVSRQYQASMVINASTGIIPPASTGQTAYAYSTARQQVDLSVGANLKKLLDLSNDISLTLSVWNLNNAVSQSYVQYPNAVYAQNKPGRSFTLSARATF
ncbi:TonB-dependent receptor [Oxalobacteraceae bacterium A2-2]